MTAPSWKQEERKTKTVQAAKDKILDKYNNNTLHTDFIDWLDNGGYERYGQDTNYGLHKTSGFRQNDMMNDMINDFSDHNKQELINYMDKNFIGLGGSNAWMDNYWSDASDDEYVNNFINTNYDNALTQLDRALKRGTLTQKGYNSALNDLNTQKSSAYTTVGNIGQGIVDDNKNTLLKQVNDFNTDIDNYNLNNYKHDYIGNFEKRLQNTYNNQQKNFQSQFDTATDGLVPFDISGIIGDARVAQGVNNTQTDPLLTAIEDTEKKKDQKVGLGNKGLF